MTRSIIPLVIIVLAALLIFCAAVIGPVLVNGFIGGQPP
jgi:hypothetical protein